MYTVKTTGETTKSFMAAIKLASAANSEVIENKTGICRWTPTPAVSEKRMRRYNERKNARNAYERAGMTK